MKFVGGGLAFIENVNAAMFLQEEKKTVSPFKLEGGIEIPR